MQSGGFERRRVGERRASRRRPAAPGGRPRLQRADPGPAQGLDRRALRAGIRRSPPPRPVGPRAIASSSGMRAGQRRNAVDALGTPPAEVAELVGTGSERRDRGGGDSQPARRRASRGKQRQRVGYHSPSQIAKEVATGHLPGTTPSEALLTAAHPRGLSQRGPSDTTLTDDEMSYTDSQQNGDLGWLRNGGCDLRRARRPLRRGR